MFSPLVSWILPSSSSSSSSSDGEENYLTDDGDNNNENVGENEHFLLREFEQQQHELPSTSCAGDDTIPDAGAGAGAVAGLPNDASPSVTVAFPEVHDGFPATLNNQKRRRIGQSRRQYQRLWTKQDEIELLRGYLDYIKHHRWATTSLQNDVAFFHDHVRPKLKTSFEKSQIVQKLRGLKRKHQINSNKINSGKEVSHKNPQEEAIFDISDRIWGKNRDLDSSEDREDDCEKNNEEDEEDEDGDEIVNTRPKPRKRARKTSNFVNEDDESRIQRLVEETLRSCLNKTVEEGSSPMMGLFDQIGNDENGDENWRRQRISELEIYLKQLGLLQDQIKARIQELQSREDDGGSKKT